jgi:hypothetical protein
MRRNANRATYNAMIAAALSQTPTVQVDKWNAALDRTVQGFELCFNRADMLDVGYVIDSINAVKRPSPTQASAPTNDAARRYEILRKLNVSQFQKLYKRNIAGEGRFDDLVDQLGAQAIEAKK